MFTWLAKSGKILATRHHPPKSVSSTKVSLSGFPLPLALYRAPLGWCPKWQGNCARWRLIIWHALFLWLHVCSDTSTRGSEGANKTCFVRRHGLWVGWVSRKWTMFTFIFVVVYFASPPWSNRFWRGLIYLIFVKLHSRFWYKRFATLSKVLF